MEKFTILLNLLFLIFSLIIYVTNAAVTKIKMSRTGPRFQTTDVKDSTLGSERGSYLSDNELLKFDENIYNTTTLTLWNYHDIAYVCEIELGTPPQVFRMHVDTGSPTMWVPDVACSQCTSVNQCNNPQLCSRLCNIESCCTKKMINAIAHSRANLTNVHIPKKELKKYDNGACTGKNLFDSSKSSTFRDHRTEEPLITNYGDGTGEEGWKSMETMTVGSITVPHQTFSRAYHVDVRMAYRVSYDGNLGLAYIQDPYLVKKEGNSPIMNMIDQGLLDEPLFSVWLTRIFTTSESEGGEIMFGGVDEDKFSGTITYQPVIAENLGRWILTMDGFQCNGRPITPVGSYRVVPDTGASVIAGPKDAIEEILKRINAHRELRTLSENSKFIVPCDQLENLPSIDFIFQGQLYPVMPRDYAFKMDNEYNLCQLAFKEIPSVLSEVDWILGDPWMRAWYHVFDIGNERVGFAKSRD